MFFNAAVKALIEGMPGSDECEHYVFTAMQPGGGAAPMFKKDAPASVEVAERAEEKMRGDLEKAWWKGLPEAEQVRACHEIVRGSLLACSPFIGRVSLVGASHGCCLVAGSVCFRRSRACYLRRSIVLDDGFLRICLYPTVCVTMLGSIPWDVVGLGKHLRGG